MSDVAKKNDGPSAWESHEPLLLRFDRAWRTDGEARLEEYLPPPGDPDRPYLLTEMIKIELEYCWNRGDKRPLEQYVAEFPELDCIATLPADLIAAELDLRQRHGEPASLSEIELRFPNRADEFQRYTSSGSTPSSTELADIDATKQVGRYQLVEELGRGSFAIVFRAHDPTLRRDVAIKCAKRELLTVPGTVQRMLSEAQAVARLQHPSIVPIYEVFENETGVYIASELIDGVTLEQSVAETAPTPAQAAEWVARLADAVDYAHRCGIIHRDIKPANVMIRGDGEPMLMDFGLAMHVDAESRLTMQGDVLGTPAFMAPEQASGETDRVDARTDVYSLGVILYQLLAGRLPFEGHSHAVMHRIVHEAPAKPSQLQHRVPRDLETICLKAMAKSPTQRYRSAHELSNDLRSWLNHEPIKARPVNALVRLTLWCQRRPALAATMLVSLLIIGTTIGVGYFSVVHERNRYRDERDRAQENLYRALVSDTRSQIQAQDTSWYWNAMENLRQAATLEVAQRDVVELRDLAVRLMGTQTPCFREIDTRQIHRGDVRHIALDSRGRWGASVGANGELKLWSIHSEHESPLTVEAVPPVLAMAADPKSSRIVTTHRDSTLRIWRVAEDSDGRFVVQPTGRQRWTGPPGTLALFSAHGQSLAIVSGQSVRQFRLEENEIVAGWELSTGAEVLCVDWSSDDSLLVTGGMDNAVRLWNVATQVNERTWSTTDPPRVIRFANSSRELIFAESETYGFKVVSTWTNRLDQFDAVHDGAVRQLLTTKFGWLSASSDGTIKIWSGKKRLAVARRNAPAVSTAQLSEDGSTLVVGHNDGTICRWALAKSQASARFSTDHRARFLVDQNTLWTGSATHEFTAGLQRKNLEFNLPIYTALACDSNRQRTVVATSSGELQLFGELNARPETKVAAHDGSIDSLAVGPDGWFVSGAADGSVKTWVWEALQLTNTWHAELGPIHQVSVSGDGRYVAASGRLGVAVWDRDESRVVWRESHYQPHGHVMFAGSWLAHSGSDGAIHVLSVGDFSLQRELPGHKDGVTAMAIDRTGRLVTAGHDQTMRIWDVSTGAQAPPLTGAFPVATWIICHPSRDLIVAGGGTTRFWTSSQSSPIASMLDYGVTHSDFDATGEHLVAASDRGSISRLPLEELTIKKTSARNGQQVALSSYHHIARAGRHIQRVWDVAVSPDGRFVATGGHDEVAKIWDAETRTLLKTLRGPKSVLWTLTFSPDSRLLVTGGSADGDGNNIHVWDVATGELVQAMSQGRLVRGMVFHPSHGWLAVARADGAIGLLDVTSGDTIVRLYKSEEPIEDLAIDPSGRWLAAACHREHLAVWNVREFDGNQIVPEPRLSESQYGRGWAVAFDPAGELLATGTAEGNVILWRCSDFSRIATLESGHRRVRSLSFSPDSSLLAAGMYDIHSLVWDLARIRRQLGTLELDWR